MKKDINILIVDDHPAVRSTMVDVLKEEGFTTDKAENGESALKKCTENQYDFVLIDVQMPKINGIDVLKKLKAQNEQIPNFIFFTAYSLPEMQNEAMKMGCLAFLQKPIQIERIISILKQSKGTTVLICLKNEKQQNLLYNSLNSKGFHALQTLNVDEALIQLRQINFNYLILDCDWTQSEHDIVRATIKSLSSNTVCFESNEDEEIHDIENRIFTHLREIS